ncbi:MAG TPA: hydroxyacid dehydrogenase [Synergistaceae bacterium]|nr:hydroxyacid dehydrogenase [Synergistaceae bacterium]
MRKTVVVTCPSPPGIRAAVERGLAGSAEVTYLEDRAGNARTEALRSASGLLSFFFNGEVDESDYPLLEDLEIFQAISTGLDYFPFRKVPVGMVLACNAGGWAPQIAEHAMALLLALTRRIVPLHNDLSRGAFNKEAFALRTLRGKVLLAAGYGGIGRHTADLAAAFGMSVWALNTSGRTDGAVERVGTLGDLEAFLPGADVLLLALPLDRNTRGIIGRRELERMKRDAILLNVARAALVSEKDLYDHLVANPDFQAGLDVWWHEPTWGGGAFETEYPFLTLPNVVGSPHNSNRCENDMVAAAECAASNLAAFFTGGTLRGLIRREDYID